MFAIALLLSLGSAVFIFMRVRRLRQNMATSSADGSSPQATPKGCHTRAAGSVTMSVLAFVLMLVAAITVWVGVLPISAYTVANFSFACYSGYGLRLPVVESGPGATCAGVVIATSFLAMVLDASSHCCCKSSGKGGAVGSTTTVVVVPPTQYVLQPQQQYAQQHFPQDAHRATVYSTA